MTTSTAAAVAIASAAAARQLVAAGRPLAALRAVERISMPRLCGATLAAVAPHLPPYLLERAARHARRLADPWARATALAGLLPHLSVVERRAAVAAVRAVLTAVEALDWLEGDLILRDVALRLAGAGDTDAARRVAATIREQRLNLATSAIVDGHWGSSGARGGARGALRWPALPCVQGNLRAQQPALPAPSTSSGRAQSAAEGNGSAQHAA